MDIEQDRIGTKALGLVWRMTAPHDPVPPGTQLLAEEIREPDGRLIGYRPLGGSIEFGENSHEALEREFIEELGEDIKIISLYSVIENIYVWGGHPGHEIVFVYELELLNKATYGEDVIERMDISQDGAMTKALWIDPTNLPDGLRLFPIGLLESKAQQ